MDAHMRRRSASSGHGIARAVLTRDRRDVFIPGICAISLGLVGHAAFDRQQGRNQAFNAAGNVGAAIAMGALGY